MSIADQFKTTNAPTNPAAPPGPAAPVNPAPRPQANAADRYGGMQTIERDPQLTPGAYLLRVVSCTEGFNPNTQANSFKAYFEVVEAEGPNTTPVGARVIVPNSLAQGQQLRFSKSRIKAMMMAVAGFTAEREYDQYDPQGRFIAAAAGDANEYSNAGHHAAGRLVACLVTRGKDDGKGDFYRQYQWRPGPGPRVDQPAAG